MARVALGITGGIGAYKAVEVARGLQKRGHDVVAVMTRNARRFVGPVTLEAITRHPVVTTSGPPAPTPTSSTSRSPRPSTCCWWPRPRRTSSASSPAGSPTTSSPRSTWRPRAPVLVAPAMNTNMLEHPAVRQNLRTLEARGVRFVQPGAGLPRVRLDRQGPPGGAGGHRRGGRSWCCGGSRSLAGLRVLVTAGPTYEDLDPVRFIGNRSSGRMGFALAREAARRGAAVTLVAGPTAVEPPAGGRARAGRSAAEMHDAVMARLDTADIVVMAAAVADYAPESRDDRKKAKSDGRR